MAAWLLAAGYPAAGEAQFLALKTAVLALSKAQLAGAWSELPLCNASQEPWPPSPQAAWERFVHASAVITDVAGCSRLPGLQARREMAAQWLWRDAALRCRINERLAIPARQRVHSTTANQPQGESACPADSTS